VEWSPESAGGGSAGSRATAFDPGAGQVRRHADASIGARAVPATSRFAILHASPAGRPHAEIGMTLLIAGLVLFLGTHSVRIFADAWRSARIAAMGEGAWKGLYSVVAIAGFVLIVWGYGEARAAPTVLYAPPLWTKHLAALLTLPAFVLLAAAKTPGTRIKAAVGHPMVLGVKLWAFAHLLSNGTLADVLLFGSFLAWAVLDYVAARRRDRAAGVAYPAGPLSRDAIAIAIGVVAWLAFALWLHGPLIGVRPFG
jgi:uncharacterized membrane protein